MASLFESETEEPWSEITARVRRNAHRTDAAIAYLGSDAGRLLPLKSGSRLVANCGELAVRQGMTNPHVLERFLRRGVRVFWDDRLHAKMVVAGRTAFVGSANASQTSATKLIEAVVSSTEPSLVARCREFVRGLCVHEVTPAQIRHLKAIYRPPLGGVTGHRGTFSAGGPRFWIVPLVSVDWDDTDQQHEAASRPVAQSSMREPKLNKLESFRWYGDRFCNEVRVNDRIFRIDREPKRLKYLNPPADVVYVESYMVGRQRRVIVHLEAPKRKQRRELSSVMATLGLPKQLPGSSYAAAAIRSRNMADSLAAIWLS